MKHRSMVTTVLAGAMALTGCGGSGGGGYGGGSSSTTQMSAANLTSAPGQAALVAYLQTDHDTMLQGMSGGRVYGLQVFNVPNAAATTFNGAAPAYNTMLTLLITENGRSLGGSTSLNYYLLNPYVPLGRVAFGGSPYAVVTSSTPLANTLSLGDSGAVDNLTYYHDSTMTTVDANQAVTYSVMANNSATVLLCLNSTISDVTAQGMTDGMVNGAASDCYAVDSSGNATLVSHTMMFNGMMMTFD